MGKKCGVIRVNARAEGAPLGDLYGIFFEDLNHAADGGLYGELIRNRSFEFDPIDRAEYHPLTAWESVESGTAETELKIETRDPFCEKNPHYLVMKTNVRQGMAGVMNLGYNAGIPVTKGEEYRFALYASVQEAVKLTVRLEDRSNGRVCAECALELSGEGWQKYECLMTAQETSYCSGLKLLTTQSAVIKLGYVSLFPVHTFRDRPNGMRRDIAQLLADMKPKFMRFPGGCLVHDGSLNSEDRNSLYRWKNTIGAVEKRPSRRNNWGYNQSLGLGYYEYFQFCEDIGAKPLPVLPGGYDPHHKRIAPIEEMGEWIEEALDLIEFANGSTDTKWGAVRAKLGHPEPFGLEYIGIGNEEVGEPFFERYPYFHKAIREKYPDIKIINTSGPFCGGGEYERGWKSAREQQSDLVDEHYYMAPEWFFANHHRYDSFDRKGPKVFLGEYASWGNTWYNALAEASYMIGLERNVPAVGLACYAPMLCNADYVNWQPDMIWFDNHRVYGTPNYYVQKLFMNHQGVVQLEATTENLGENQVTEYSMAGKLAVKGDGSRMKFTNIRVTELAENRTACKQLPDYVTEPGEDFTVLGEVEWENYCLECDAEELEGYKGCQIAFSMKDMNNTMFWTIGGWQNQDMAITERINGRQSDLSQCLFTVEKQHIYHLKLVVQDHRITGMVDGTEYICAERKPVVVEPLYCCASRDDNGDFIVKAVNVQNTPKEVTLRIENRRELTSLQAKVYTLASDNKQAVNSFEQPQNIYPEEHEETVRIIPNQDAGGSTALLDYQIRPQSVTIFRFHESCV